MVILIFNVLFFKIRVHTEDCDKLSGLCLSIAVTGKKNMCGKPLNHHKEQQHHINTTDLFKTGINETLCCNYMHINSNLFAHKRFSNRSIAHTSWADWNSVVQNKAAKPISAVRHIFTYKVQHNKVQSQEINKLHPTRSPCDPCGLPFTQTDSRR